MPEALVSDDDARSPARTSAISLTGSTLYLAVLSNTANACSRYGSLSPSFTALHTTAFPCATLSGSLLDMSTTSFHNNAWGAMSISMSFMYRGAMDGRFSSSLPTMARRGATASIVLVNTSNLVVPAFSSTSDGGSNSNRASASSPTASGCFRMNRYGINSFMSTHTSLTTYSSPLEKLLPTAGTSPSLTIEPTFSILAS
mmetsp:Transcript_52937/g.158469  ORF Transcript_52937/g.158469 Transcript_52937/m.158469 type:complete len:200 (-) Transcript_52937:1133-1732(-)